MNTAIQTATMPVFGQTSDISPLPQRQITTSQPDTVHFGQSGEKKRSTPALLTALTMVLSTFVPDAPFAEAASDQQVVFEEKKPSKDYQRFFQMSNEALAQEEQILDEQFAQVARQGIQDLRDRYAELEQTYQPVPQPVLGYESDGKPIDTSRFPAGTFPETTQDVKPGIIREALEQMDAILAEYDRTGNARKAYCNARLVTAFHNLGDEPLLSRLDRLAGEANTIDLEQTITNFLLRNSLHRTPDGGYPQGILNAVEKARDGWAVGCAI